MQFLRPLADMIPTIRFRSESNDPIFYDCWPIRVQRGNFHETVGRSESYDPFFTIEDRSESRSESNAPIVTIVGRSESNEPIFSMVDRSESNDPIVTIVGRSESKHPFLIIVVRLESSDRSSFTIIDRSESSDRFVAIVGRSESNDPFFTIVGRLDNDLFFSTVD